MAERLEDRNVVDIVPLIAPRAVKSAQPASDTAAALVLDTRRAIRDILHGRDTRRPIAFVEKRKILHPCEGLLR